MLFKVRVCKKNICIYNKFPALWLITKRQFRKMNSEREKTKLSEEEAFQKNLHSFEENVDLNKLDHKAKCIHQKHVEALQNMQDTYTDPETGYNVFTRLAHLRRGKCCGSACRHCPFGQIAAPNDKKKKFNSAFYY